MRNLKLTAEEAKFAFQIVNAPTNPQRGLTTSEIDTRLELYEKLESTADKKTVAGGESLAFKDCEVKLKESEFNKLIEIFTTFECWGSVDDGRKGKKLVEKIKETTKEDDK